MTEFEAQLADGNSDISSLIPASPGVDKIKETLKIISPKRATGDHLEIPNDDIEIDADKKVISTETVHWFSCPLRDIRLQNELKFTIEQILRKPKKPHPVSRRLTKQISSHQELARHVQDLSASSIWNNVSSQENMEMACCQVPCTQISCLNRRTRANISNTFANPTNPRPFSELSSASIGCQSFTESKRYQYGSTLCHQRFPPFQCSRLKTYVSSAPKYFRLAIPTNFANLHFARSIELLLEDFGKCRAAARMEKCLTYPIFFLPIRGVSGDHQSFDTTHRGLRFEGCVHSKHTGRVQTEKIRNTFDLDSMRTLSVKMAHEVFNTDDRKTNRQFIPKKDADLRRIKS